MITGIDLIEADHRRVEELFELYEREKQAVVAAQIFAELAAHDDAETGALYPLASALLGPEAIDDALLAHAGVKMLIERARSLEGAAFDQAITVLREAVVAHVADEEKALLPKLAKAADAAQLAGLAARIEQVKQRVGRHVAVVARRLALGGAGERPRERGAPACPTLSFFLTASR